MTIRPAEDEEAGRVLALYREAAAQENSCWDDDYPDESFVRFDLEGKNLFVLEEEGLLIGAVSLVAHDDLDELPIWHYDGSCALARLCVRPDRQGRGLGRLMVEKACAEAGSRGCESIRLLADQRNAAANGLYQKLGFEERGRALLYGHEYRAWERRLCQRAAVGTL